MAKVPKAVRQAFDSAPVNTSLGTATWVKTQSKQRQDEFRATIEAYLKGRADGTLRISIEKLAQALRAEFDYPFGWGALRSYMAKHYPKLFEKQLLVR